MKDIHLHIVSFDIPFPANYGGVIDVYYKIRALAMSGVRVHLHCFEYRRKPVPELEELCHEVHYYPRAEGLISWLHFKPYIVFSRRSSFLLDNLRKDNFPILFEGLHSCYFLGDKGIKNRFKIYRESNIEHTYYYHLFKSEKQILPKFYYLAESFRLRIFQKILRHADLMLTVSKEDNEYLAGHFPRNKVVWLPSFHRGDTVQMLPGKGKFILFQGKMSVPENIRAAEFLIREVMDENLPELVIAGLDPPEHLFRLVASRKNIRIIANPDDDEMFRLIREAHVNIMVTFQATGLKLKLLNALFNGRFCLVNPEMVHGTDLTGLCEIACSPSEFKSAIMNLYNLEFTENMIREREVRLMENHSNAKNCKILLNLVHL
jgi:glycosyltransferase involved in cell wall biosynthesis